MQTRRGQRRRRRSYRRQHTGGGGVFIDDQNYEQNFKEFMKNAEFSYLSAGTYGSVFIATLNDGAESASKYKHMECNVYGEPVKKLLVKFTAIDIDVPASSSSSGSTSSKSSNVKTVSHDDIRKEVNVQTIVFQKTMNYLQPLCPAIVYSGTFTPADTTIMNDVIQSALSKLDKTDESNHDKIKKVESLNPSTYSYSVIAMELADGYVTMYSALKDYTTPEQQKFLTALMKYMVLEMALQTGYSHADFHWGNILFNPTDTSYFIPADGNPYEMFGSAVLIDFGLSAPIPHAKLNAIKQCVENQQYDKAISYVCTVERSDTLDVRRFAQYERVCNEFKHFTRNELFHAIRLARATATDAIQAEFNAKHATDPTKYPLLPLSNAMKNKMFPGMIDEPTISKDETPVLTLAFKCTYVKTVVMQSLRHILSSVNEIYVPLHNDNADYNKLPNEFDIVMNACFYFLYIVQSDTSIMTYDCPSDEKLKWTTEINNTLKVYIWYAVVCAFGQEGSQGTQEATNFFKDSNSYNNVAMQDMKSKEKYDALVKMNLCEQFRTRMNVITIATHIKNYKRMLLKLCHYLHDKGNNPFLENVLLWTHPREMAQQINKITHKVVHDFLNKHNNTIIYSIFCPELWNALQPALSNLPVPSSNTTKTPNQPDFPFAEEETMPNPVHGGRGRRHRHKRRHTARTRRRHNRRRVCCSCKQKARKTRKRS